MDSLSLDELYDLEESIKKLIELKRSKTHPQLVCDSGDVRNTVLPINRHDLWKGNEHQINTLWFVKDVNFEGDKKDIALMSEDERNVLFNILAFFASFDEIVNKNIQQNIIEQIPYIEMKHFYCAQQLIECIHSHSYSLMITTLVDDPKLSNELLRSVEHNPAVLLKVEFVKKYFNRKVPLIKCIVAGVCLEFIQFIGSFAFIYRNKALGITPGICNANHLIARDEFHHANMGAMIYKKFVPLLSREEVLEIIDESVQIEKKFMKMIMPRSIAKMSTEDMSDYIEYIGDIALNMLGYDRHYHKNNPFMFMDMMSTGIMENFFEGTATQYKNATFNPNDIKLIEDDSDSESDVNNE